MVKQFRILVGRCRCFWKTNPYSKDGRNTSSEMYVTTYHNMNPRLKYWRNQPPSPPLVHKPPLVGHCLLITKDSRSQSDIPHSVVLLWTRDRPVAETSKWHSQEIDIHAPAGFEPAIPASERPKTDALDRAATDIGQLVMYVSNWQRSGNADKKQRSAAWPELTTEFPQRCPVTNKGQEREKRNSATNTNTKSR